MLQKGILSLCVLAAVAAGCSRDRSVGRRLEAAAAVMTEYPDSAAGLLRSIAPDAGSRRQQARRGLLLSRAFNRMETGIGSDSLIRPALEYFERHGSESERAQAWYLHAQALRHAGDIEKAVRSYTQAAIHAERCPDEREMPELLGTVCHTLGSIYLEQGDYAEAAEAFSAAADAARTSGDTEAEMYALFMRSEALYGEERYPEAIATLAPLAAMRDTIPFRFFALTVTLQNLLYHTAAGDWSVRQLLEERARIDPREFDNIPLQYGRAAADDAGRTLYDFVSALVFHSADQPDSALRYIDRVLKHTDGFTRGNIGIYTIASAIHHQRGEDTEAYSYAMKYISARDSVTAAMKGTIAAQLEKRFRRENEAALREARLRYRNRLAAMAVLLLAGAAAGAAAGYRRKLRRRDELLNERLALLDSYRESHDSLISRLDASDAREAAVKRILEGRIAAVRELAATSYTYGDGARLAEKMRELALSPATLADVVRTADLYCDGAVSRLRERLPGLTPRNYDFAALVFAGFSPQEISVLLGMTLNGVYTLKSKLKRRIAALPDNAFFTERFM